MGGVPLTDVLYGAYERRLAKQIPPEAVPRHVGVMLDGNRRWARENGFETVDGHQAGADKIKHLLEWCEAAGVEVVTLWLLSTDNLSRSRQEIVPLLKIIETAVADLAIEGRWRLHPIGALDLLPAETAQSLKASAEATRGIDGLHVNVAVGYGGRREIADAVRSLILEHAAQGTPVDADRRLDLRRGDRAAPLHQGPARPRPRHPHVGGAAARRLPPLAEREVGVLLLRGVLAGLPARRLPPGVALVCEPGAPLRPLTGIPDVSGW